MLQYFYYSDFTKQLFINSHYFKPILLLHFFLLNEIKLIFTQNTNSFFIKIKISHHDYYDFNELVVYSTDVTILCCSIHFKYEIFYLNYFIFLYYLNLFLKQFYYF